MPVATKAGVYLRRRARIQALQWHTRLETSECLDELWPDFEAWLAALPVNHVMFLTAERTRTTIDQIAPWCPKEGSEGAQQLLRRLADRRWTHHSRTLTKYLLVTTIVMMTVIAVLVSI